MHINSLDTAAILSDAELLAAVKRLAAHERHATAQLMAHLAELVAALRPQPPVPSSVRMLPQTHQRTSPDNASEDQPDLRAGQREALYPRVSLQFAQVQETTLVEEGIFVRIPSCRMTSIRQTSATRSCSSRCHMDYSTTYQMKTNVRLPRLSGSQSD
jgi:hypothetical protein